MKKKKKQILVVEDERIVAADVRMSLKRLGYDACGIATSGEHAIKKAEEARPDLVLMDIVLEGEMDGIEATSIIQSRFDIPVVYLTAYADEKTLERAKKSEPFGYILKPFEDKDVHSTIEMALHKYEMGKLLKESEERYRGVVENAHDAIYILALNSFQYVNPAFESLTGRSKKELCSKEFNFWKIVHPDDIKLVRAKKSQNKALNRIEFKIISKDGEEKAVEANTVIIGKDGEAKEMGILRDITVRKKIEEERIQNFERLKRNLEETINALALAVEMRDAYTAGHQKRVTQLACAIAEEMGLPEEKIEGIRMAGMIHDVGKVLIPAEILSRPGLLSKIDFSMIQTHPKVGHDILKTIEFPYPVAQIVLQHHERMNGSGYPEGLTGRKILVEARVLGVADVVEAISSRRPYRASLGIKRALDEISKKKGILYDPDAVSACLRLFNEKNFKFNIEKRKEIGDAKLD
jgi:PAS domain S-box-containing protein/putative nucleotidyltransferase with HDIG domain